MHATSDTELPRRSGTNFLPRGGPTAHVFAGDVCRTHSRKAQVFFHVSALEGLPVSAGAGGDLSAAVRPGQHVEFEVQEADGRLQAVGVRRQSGLDSYQHSHPACAVTSRLIAQM